MLDPEFDPYDIMANHAEAISNLIRAVKDNSNSQVKISAAQKELSNSLVKMYTEMKDLEHRVTRLERQYNAFEQTTADNRPPRQ